MDIILGSEESNKTYRGWAVGHMQIGIAQTTACEVKLWRYDKLIDYGRKKFMGAELIVVYGGTLEIRLQKDGEKKVVILAGQFHDYVIIPPGIEKEVVVLLTPAFGVTVRWPSFSGLNEVVK